MQLNWCDSVRKLRTCVCLCAQAEFWCTVSRAKKVTAILTVAAPVLTAVLLMDIYLGHVYVGVTVVIVLSVILPVVVLALNVVVALQVRRSTSNAASANLGVQHSHHQTSTSNNSAVPTVMLLATSLIFALIYGVGGIFYAAWEWMVYRAGPIYDDVFEIVDKSHIVAMALLNFVFAYNFYVYLITGRQFRAELRKLFSRCLPSSSSLAPAAPTAVVAAGNDA